MNNCSPMPIYTRVIGVAALCLLLLLSGCDLLEEAINPAAGTPRAAATSTLTPNVTQTSAVPSANSTPLPESKPIRELRVWLAPDPVPDVETAAGSLFFDQIDQFSAADTVNPGVQSETKVVGGQGGIISYLRAAETVAPAILPDVVLVPAVNLPEMVQDGLVFPLDNLVSEEATADLYPAAYRLGQVGETLYGYPYIVEGIDHIIYRTTVTTQTVPTTWRGLIDSPFQMLFPAVGPAGTHMVRRLYVAEGGILRTEAGAPRLEIPPLTQVLSNIQRGRETGAVLPASGAAVSAADVWQVYVNGNIPMTYATPEQYWTNQMPADSDFAPLPGVDGPLPSELDGWVWAVTTADPQRQQRAIDLVMWLSTDENLGEWSRQARQIPARRGAFNVWPDDPYHTFLQTELARAVARPPINSSVSDALAVAMRDLFAVPDPSSQAIAEQASAAVQP